MAGRTLAGALGLTGDWDLGENNWKDANDLNLLKLSVTVQGRALELVSATPGAPTEGDVYLFDDTHPTQAGKIAVYDEASWKYITPSEGWRMWDVDADFLREFNGTTWIEVTSGGGGGSALEIEDEGVSEDAAVVKINFTGAGVTATQTAPGEVDVDIPGGGGGGGGSLENTMIPPEVADFSVSRFGTGGAASDFALGVSLEATISAANTNSLTYLANAIPAPGAAGWRATGRFRRHTPWSVGLSMGMMLRNSSGGSSKLFWVGQDPGFGILSNQFNSDTSWNNVALIAASWFDNDFWMEIEDDLTNRIIRISADGFHWQRVLSESRTTWVTPDQVGFFLNPNGFAAGGMQNTQGRFSCLSWEVVTLP